MRIVLLLFLFSSRKKKLQLVPKPHGVQIKKEPSEREATTPRQRYGLSKQRALQMTISRGKGGERGGSIREEGSGREGGETNVWVSGGIMQSSEQRGGHERGNIPPCPH